MLEIVSVGSRRVGMVARGRLRILGSLLLFAEWELWLRVNFLNSNSLII